MSDESPSASDHAPVKRRPGRPTGGDMAQLTLRLPRDQFLALTEESARRSLQAGRNVTLQAVIVSMIAEGLAAKSQDAPNVE